jgi:hypothetical protein
MALTSTAHKVLLLKIAPDNYRARPAYQPAAPGEDVRFVNLTGGTVVITFPAGLFTQDTLTLAQGTKNTLTVRDQLPDGRYVYAAQVGGVDVQGESSPEIIVDR